MPRSFDDVLPIDEHGCLSPAGPLDLAAGETAVRLDVWVFQIFNDGKDSACAAVQRDFPVPGRWTTNPDPRKDHAGGPFRPGRATGMALLVVKDGKGATRVEQWKRDNIELT
jgi:hypothetical protein